MNAIEFENNKFSSERLSYHLYTQADLDDVHGLLCLQETDKYNTLGVMKSPSQTQSVMESALGAHNADEISSFYIVLRLKENGQMLGLVGINLQNPKYRSAEIWFKLLPKYWNQGFATEAVNWLFYFGFEKLKLHRIVAGCAVENRASFKVMEKTGMRREGISVKTLPLNGDWVDTYEYAILNEEFQMNKLENQAQS